MKTINQQLNQIKLLNLWSVLSLFAGLIFISCDSSADSDFIDDREIQETKILAKGLENAPSESGMFVIRYDDVTAYTLIDNKTGLVLLINQEDRSPFYCEGGGILPDTFTVQEIIAGNKNPRILLQARGDIPAQVFQGHFVFNNNISEFCAFLTEATLLANGYVSLVYHDNDGTSSFQPNYTNTFGFAAQGRLLNSEGEYKHLNAQFLFQWKKDQEDVNGLLDLVIKQSVKLH